MTCEATRKSLTKREIDVLVEVAKGYSAKEIGMRLHVAPRTVDKHVETMLLKLAARNRSHMVVMAIAGGLITIGGRSEDGPLVVPAGIPVGTMIPHRIPG